MKTALVTLLLLVLVIGAFSDDDVEVEETPELLQEVLDTCVRSCDRTCGDVGIESEETKAATSCQDKCNLCVDDCLETMEDASLLRCRSWCTPMWLPEPIIFSLEAMTKKCKASSVPAHHDDEYIKSLVIDPRRMALS